MNHKVDENVSKHEEADESGMSPQMMPKIPVPMRIGQSRFAYNPRAKDERIKKNQAKEIIKAHALKFKKEMADNPSEPTTM